jgi:hypothetical protein
MNLTRRGLVSAGVAALVGTAGCLGGGSNVRYPSDDGGTVDDASEPLVDASSTPAAADADSDSAERTVPNPDLARRTRLVVDELAWFGAEYDAAVAAYRAALATAESTTREVLASETVGDEELARLRSATVQARTVAERELGGHFAVAGLIDDVASEHIEVVEKFAARGDRDRADAELRRLAGFFNGLRGRPYVDANLSSDPIRNRLLARLRGGDASADAPGLFAVLHGPTDFRSFAYAGGERHFRAAAFDGSVARVEAPFGALRTPDRRRAVTVVRTYAMPPRADWPAVVDRSRHPGDTIHVQEYADATVAGDVLASLLEGDVTQEETRRLGDRRWRRVYYRRGGDVTYAFVLQAGPFLLSVAASETAWEERTNWREPLRRSWVV